MLVNLTQKDIEHIISEVLRYLKEENNVPLELISGEMIDRGLVTEGLITSYSATSFRNLLKKLIPISKYPEISSACWTSRSLTTLPCTVEFLL